MLRAQPGRWRLKDDGNATNSVAATSRFLVNMRRVETLSSSSISSGRCTSDLPEDGWFERWTLLGMWWVPVGQVPTPQRPVAGLLEHGPAHAFGWESLPNVSLDEQGRLSDR
jgi:hypothetical protein